MLARPGRPDLIVLHTLAMEAELAVLGFGEAPMRGLLASEEAAPRSGAAALAWLDHLDRLLTAADNEVDSRIPADRRMPYLRARDLVVAHRAMAEATVIRRLGRREEAARSYQRAAELFARHDLPNVAASARLGYAELLAIRLGQRDQAAEVLAGVAADSALNPVMRLRQRAALFEVVVLAGQTVSPRQPGGSASARGTALRQRDLQTLAAERAVAGMGETRARNGRST